MDKTEFLEKIKALEPDKEILDTANQWIEDIESDELGIFSYDLAWKNISELMFM